jgi:hypothetical protein
MRQDLKRLLRSDLLSFARKALTETSGETMPEDRYLELLAGRLADLVTGDSKRLIFDLPVGLDPGTSSLGEDPDVDLRSGACR